MTGDADRKPLDYESIVPRERRGERDGKVGGWVVILVVVGSVLFLIVKGLLGLKLPSPG